MRWIIIKLFFFQGVISTAIDLAELNSPGVSPMIYADIEASSKLGGLKSIKKMQSEKGSIFTRFRILVQMIQLQL